MKDQYPDLERHQALIASTCKGEEVQFRETLERGLKLLDEEIVAVIERGETSLSGAAVFKLKDTYGFPQDLTEVIAQERGLGADMVEFERLLEEQRRRSDGGKLNDAEAVEQVWREVLDAAQKASPGGVKFVGYEREESEGKVVAIVKGGRLAIRATQGEDAILVTDVTPFYGESGGQVGDVGVIERRDGAEPLAFEVTDTQKPIAGVFAHYGKVGRGGVAVGDKVHLEVDHAKRTATRRNHSATHLLHWALRTVLGEQATQKGSLVGPDRLRFDFAHGKALTRDETRRIEDLVNGKVLTDAPVLTEVLPIDVARQRGAVAIFEEKYGDVVRMLTMTRDSVELCGGTHARSLGEIGLFKIKSEGGLAAGVRRIEAATGMGAVHWVQELEQASVDAARAAGTSVDKLGATIERFAAERRLLEKEIADLKRQVAMGGNGAGGGGIDAMLAGAREVPGGKALAVRANVDDAATLREMAEKLRDKLGDAVVLVGAPGKDKAMLVLTVSKALTDRYKAGDLIKGIAQIVGGSGGGRPDMAQAGGTDVSRLDEALESLYARLS
jgi:alanyl-tRNA synthetase